MAAVSKFSKSILPSQSIQLSDSGKLSSLRNSADIVIVGIGSKANMPSWINWNHLSRCQAFLDIYSSVDKSQINNILDDFDVPTELLQTFVDSGKTAKILLVDQEQDLDYADMLGTLGGVPCVAVYIKGLLVPLKRKGYESGSKFIVGPFTSVQMWSLLDSCASFSSASSKNISSLQLDF